MRALLIIALTFIWVRALVRSDGKKPCKPEDCATCPFPPCDPKPWDEKP